MFGKIWTDMIWLKYHACTKKPVKDVMDECHKQKRQGANPCRFSIFKWSGRHDLNMRPPAPKAGALPNCATPRYTSLSDARISISKTGPFVKQKFEGKNLAVGCWLLAVGLFYSIYAYCKKEGTSFR
jgi:hypothetical protein